MEEYTPEFVAEMQKIMKQKHVFVGTFEEFKKYTDNLATDKDTE